MSLPFFWVLALIAVGASIMVVASQNPVRSALYLVTSFLCVAAFYITLSAQFIAAVQVIVYAGAIMVLFLFVIMLLNLSAPQALRETGRLHPIATIGLAVVFISTLVFSQSLAPLSRSLTTSATAESLGTVEAVGLTLFSSKLPWLFPFEITSILLLVAVIGAIIMAKRRVD